MKRLALLLTCLTTVCLGLAQANMNRIVYLERGKRAVVPCPLVKSRQISPEDIDAVYWYFESTSRSSLLISYFFGTVAPQNGIPEGVYDIDSDFGLVIENVTACKEERFYVKVKPHLKMVEQSWVQVLEKVSPRRPNPRVVGCDQDQEMCDMRVQHDTTVHSLTCVMERVKPAVELRWFRAHPRGERTELEALVMISPVTLPTNTSLSLRNNTYVTSALVQISPVDEEADYICEASGVAVGNRTSTRVRLTKTRPTTATNDKTTSVMTSAHDDTGTTVALDCCGLEKDFTECQTNTVPIVISAISFALSVGSMVRVYRVHQTLKKQLAAKVGYV